MRDIVSCFSENSINISNPSCSSNSSNVCVSVNCLYKLTLSSHKQVFVLVSWSSHGLCIVLNNDSSLCFKLNSGSSLSLGSGSSLFRKKKGSKFIDPDSKIEVLWDLNLVKYDTSGPEPISGFYLILLIDSEIGLALGDLGEEMLNKRYQNCAVAKVCLASRQEYCWGKSLLYATKTKFSGSGIQHEIRISVSVDQTQKTLRNERKRPVLSVVVDGKNVIHVKRLQWNFRGNQSIFVDGLLIDVFWDVHDWFFGCGYGVFMFRTRSGLDSNRLWLEDNKKLVGKEEESVEFSLLICACKSTP